MNIVVLVDETSNTSPSQQVLSLGILYIKESCFVKQFGVCWLKIPCNDNDLIFDTMPHTVQKCCFLFAIISKLKLEMQTFIL